MVKEWCFGGCMCMNMEAEFYGKKNGVLVVDMSMNLEAGFAVK